MSVSYRQEWIKNVQGCKDDAQGSLVVDTLPSWCNRRADLSSTPMLSVATLRGVRTIITHDECPDGVASAVLLHDALPGAAVEFMQHGTDAHRNIAPRAGLLFCDFSPLPDRAADFARAGTIVLDHHRTAKEVVRAMGDRGVFGDERADPGVSGAVLAHRHVWVTIHGDSPLRQFAEHFASVAGVRDTWQTNSHLWTEGRAQAELLLAFPQAWWLERSFSHIASSWTDKLAPLGDALVAKQDDRVRRAVADGHRFVAGGTSVFVISGTSLTSDAMRLLGAKADVLAGFDFSEERARPKMHVSLRSEGTFDCAAFALRHGGGGHTHAAGFTVTLEPGAPQPYTLIERIFQER